MTSLLLSAYACEPGRGSEPGAGWAWAVAAAGVVDRVRLITRQCNVSAVERGLSNLGISNVEVRGLELGPIWLRLKKTLPYGTQLYYIAWQRALARHVADLDPNEFTVAHHLTFAVDWLPAGVSAAPCPLVWGPVGGATHSRWSELSLYPPPARPAEILRNWTTGIGRLLWGRPIANTASVVLAQNRDEITAFPRARVRLAPNVVAEPPPPETAPLAHIDAPFRAPTRARAWREAVIVGRLIPLKAVRYAIRALAQRQAAEWRLTVIGSGPDEPALRALVGDLRLTDRVIFAGQLKHEEVITHIQQADAMISVSLHEAAGFAIAEAVAAGTPVIYADRGGPPDLADTSDFAIPVTSNLAQNVAAALEVVGDRRAPTDRWSAKRLPALLREVYSQVEGGVD